MDTSVIVALITGFFTIVGTIITVMYGNAKNSQNMRISQAITDTKIEALTEEVKAHNDFARRMPVVEEQIKVINHRISDLETASNR